MRSAGQNSEIVSHISGCKLRIETLCIWQKCRNLHPNRHISNWWWLNIFLYIFVGFSLLYIFFGCCWTVSSDIFYARRYSINSITSHLQFFCKTIRLNYDARSEANCNVRTFFFTLTLTDIHKFCSAIFTFEMKQPRKKNSLCSTCVWG